MEWAFPERGAENVTDGVGAEARWGGDSLDAERVTCPSRRGRRHVAVPGEEELQAAAGQPCAVSVVTPCFNAGRLLPETARSVLAQSVRNLEWLIVDDGGDASQAAVFEAIRKRDPRARVIRQERRRGPAAARNRGAREARSGFLLFLDADDLIEPSYAEKMLMALASFGEAAWAYSGVVLFGSENRVWIEEFIPALMFERNLCPMVSLVRREAHEACGGFDESYEGHEDWDYWMRHLAAGHHGVLVRECLEHHRYHPRSRRVDIDARDPDNRAARERFGREYGERCAKLPNWQDGRHRLRPVRYAPVRPEPLLDARDVVVRAALSAPRVLVVTNHLQCGGADRFTLRLVEYLRAEGASVTAVLTAADESDWLERLYRLTADVWLLPQTVAAADWLNAVYWLIESRNIDRILFTQSVWGYHAAPLIALQYPSIPFFDYTHVEEPAFLNGGHPRYSALMRDCWSRSFCNTEHLKRHMVERFGHDAERIEVHRTGIDTQGEFDPEKLDRREARERLGLPPDVSVVLHVSRLTPQKRPESLAPILSSLQARGCDLRLVVVGGDYPSADRLRADMRRCGLDGRMVWFPPTSEMAPFYAASDCLLLPSWYEGLAMVIAEALAMELPVVASDVGGQRELLQGDIGWLIPLAHPECGRLGDAEREAYADALADALARGRSHPRAGAAARARAVSMYALENTLAPLARRIARHETAGDTALAARAARLAPQRPHIENAYWNILAASEFDLQTFTLHKAVAGCAGMAEEIRRRDRDIARLWQSAREAQAFVAYLGSLPGRPLELARFAAGKVVERARKRSRG